MIGALAVCGHGPTPADNPVLGSWFHAIVPQSKRLDRFAAAASAMADILPDLREAVRGAGACLSYDMVLVLLALERQAPGSRGLIVADLAKVSGSTNASYQLQRLVEQDLVEVHTAERDRRRRHASITTRGRELLRQIREALG